MSPLTRRWPAALLAALALLAPHWVLADDDDTLSIIPGISAMHDDNLFRVPDNASPKSEDITISSVTLKLNKRYSLQRFELEASYIDYRYKNYSYLSYDAQPYKAAWRWSLTPYLHGNLTTDRTTSLQSFADYSNVTRRNLNTTENSRFDGTLDISPSWHVLAGVSHNMYENTQITEGQRNSEINRAEAGLRYTPSTGSSVSYIARSGRGEYTGRSQFNLASSNASFDESENEIRGLWALTAKTRVDARLGYLERNHDNLSARDYSGAVGALNFSWTISGKSMLTAVASRNLASYQTLNTNYTSTDRIALIPYWQISAKTGLRARYDYARQDYLGTPGIFAASNRQDTLRTAMIAFEWQPLRTATLSAALQNDKRNSNQPGLDYVSNMATLSAQIAF